MSIGKQFLEEFIAVYKNEVALWQVKNENYRNKNEKNKSFNILLRKTKEYEKDATIETVKRKINSLRTSYRREYQKIRRSEKNGADEYGVYVPTLWYFGLLDFLRDQDIQMEDGSISTMNDPLEFEKKVESVEKPMPAKRQNIPDEDQDPILIETPQPPSPKRLKIIEEDFQQIEKSPSPVATNRKISEEDLLQIAAEHLENAKKQPPRDEAQIFSEGWAMMYRKLDGQQKIFAKRIIDETLMHGQFGQLTYSSSLNFFDGKD